jgi:hypothetical protein
MPESIDPALERLLVETLTGRADRLPATLTLERVQARLAQRQHTRSRPSARRPLALLGLAAALLLPMAALVIGQRPTEPPIDPDSAYQAIVRRTAGDAWLVVTMRGDGQERVLTSVPLPDPGDDRRRPQMAVSTAGWLAWPGSTGWEFRDLRFPERAVGPLDPFLVSEVGHAWIGDGRFAAWNANGEVVLHDPDAAAVERASLPAPQTSVVAWTADGAAIVSHGDWGRRPIVSSGQRRPPDWRVHSLDGRTVDTALGDLDLGWRSGTWWRADGSRVQVCDMAVREECPGLPNGSVIVEGPDGTLSTWYQDELGPADVVDAAFGAASLWLLLDQRTDGRQVALARAESPGDVRAVTTWHPGSSPIGPGSTEGVAPDESLVVADSRLVDTRTGTVTPIDGSFLGFVPSATVDAWPGGAFEAVLPAASEAPPLTPYPTLRSLDLVLAEQLTPGDRLLWREEHTAVPGKAVAPSTVETGPIEPEEGLGVFLVCSGPSDVLVTMRGPDDLDVDPGLLTPLLSRCLNGDEVAGGYAPAAAVDGPVRFFVTSTTDTDWQLVVFDPAPES